MEDAAHGTMRGSRLLLLGLPAGTSQLGVTELLAPKCTQGLILGMDIRNGFALVDLASPVDMAQCLGRHAMLGQVVIAMALTDTVERELATTGRIPPALAAQMLMIQAPPDLSQHGAVVARPIKHERCYSDSQLPGMGPKRVRMPGSLQGFGGDLGSLYYTPGGAMSLVAPSAEAQRLRGLPMFSSVHEGFPASSAGILEHVASVQAQLDPSVQLQRRLPPSWPPHHHGHVRAMSDNTVMMGYEPSPIVMAHMFGGGIQASPGGSSSSPDINARRARFGLSYKCGRCGQPKKGHNCAVSSKQGAPAAYGAPAEASGEAGEDERADAENLKESAPPAAGGLKNSSVFGADGVIDWMAPQSAPAPAGTAALVSAIPISGMPHAGAPPRPYRARSAEDPQAQQQQQQAQAQAQHSLQLLYMQQHQSQLQQVQRQRQQHMLDQHLQIQHLHQQQNRGLTGGSPWDHVQHMERQRQQQMMLGVTPQVIHGSFTAQAQGRAHAVGVHAASNAQRQFPDAKEARASIHALSHDMFQPQQALAPCTCAFPGHAGAPGRLLSSSCPETAVPLPPEAVAEIVAAQLRRALFSGGSGDDGGGQTAVVSNDAGVGPTAFSQMMDLGNLDLGHLHLDARLVGAGARTFRGPSDMFLDAAGINEVMHSLDFDEISGMDLLRDLGLSQLTHDQLEEPEDSPVPKG
mmetsp:Transcript_22317/g.51887  ORF Transcript_22317/g.51887 Transcript_22317/m.51887 type:complete len:690 (-) Transcript_22317:236-2305(-)